MIKKIEVGIFIFFLILSGFFSTYKLKESPSVWYDEGFYVQVASNLSTHGKYGLQLLPGEIEPVSRLVTVGYPLIYPLASAFKIFGHNILVARGVMVFFILGFVIGSYLLARRLFGVRHALASFGLLATFAPLYGNGKSVLGEVPGLFFMAISLLILEKALSGAKRSDIKFILAGVFAGLCASTKPIFLLFLLSIGLILLIKWHQGKLRMRNVILLAVSVLVPLIIWVYIQFSFNENIINILSYYVKPFQEKSIHDFIFENLRHFISDSGPIYLLVMILAWLSGLIIRRRKKIEVSASEMVSFVFSILISLAYLRTNGWYRFIFPAQAVSLIYFSKSISLIIEFIGEKLKLRVFPRVCNFFWIMPIFCFSILGAYQIMFKSFVAEAYKSDKTAFWENYFKDIRKEQIFFFYDTPEVAALNFGGKYYQYISPNGRDIGSSGLKAIDLGIPERIILRTDAYEWGENRFSKYRPQTKAYKYTILIKK